MRGGKLRDKKRHIKAHKKETWTDLRTEIRETCESLDIPSTYFSEVGIHEWQPIENKIWSVFTLRPNSGWKWNSLKVPYFSFKHHEGYKYLTQLTGDEERAWFIVEDHIGEKTKFWLYEGNMKALQMVLSEIYSGSEFYIVSKNYDWMLCYNHHDFMIGTGKMMQKLQMLEQELYSKN